MWALALLGFNLLPEYFEVKTSEMRMAEVYWMAVDDVDAYCRRSMDVSNFVTINGCATYSLKNQQCIIVTGKNTDTSVLGHELRHCFDGSFHGAPPKQIKPTGN